MAFRTHYMTFFETHRHIVHIAFDVFFFKKLCVLCVYVFQKKSNGELLINEKSRTRLANSAFFMDETQFLVRPKVMLEIENILFDFFTFKENIYALQIVFKTAILDVR